jgi:hydroxymethylbilane synthase
LAFSLRIATRGSALARWQAADVARELRAARPGLAVDLVVIATTGDARRDVPVWELGGQGVFVKEVQAAVLDGRADLAVHSAKDLPSSTPEGLDLAAVTGRADPRDALVGSRLADLGPGARVATGSVRRRAQLAWVRPDLTFDGLRGNIGTRLGQVPEGGAIVVAAAAVQRLGLADRIAEVLPVAVMLPQVGQGAIAVECRAGDEPTRSVLAAIADPAAGTAVTAERAFLARLGGGCDLPVGAFALPVDGEALRIEGLLASADGRVLLRGARLGPAADPVRLGSALAEELLAAGGAELAANGYGNGNGVGNSDSNGGPA